MTNEAISVLYVDDEPGLLEIGKLFLEESGFKVDTTVYPKEVVNLIKKNSYEAIVSDYQMPGMNGIELVKAVREEFPVLPFILFTGRGREDVVIEAINNKVDFYLQKGGNPNPQFAELAHKIRKAVGAVRESVQKEKERLEKIEEKERSKKRINSHANNMFYIIESEEGLSTKKILKQGTEESGAEAGYYAQIEGENGDEKLVIVESYGLRTEEFMKMTVPKKNNNLVGLGGEVIKTKRGAIANHYLSSLQLIHDEKVDAAVRAEKIESAMAVPIISSKGKVKGVYYVFTRNKELEFTEDDLEILFITAGFIGMIEQKKRAREEKEKVAKKLAFISEIARHAIKNHATVILGSADLAFNVTTQAEVKRLLSMISGATERLVKEVKNVEDYHRLGINKLQFVSIADLVRHYQGTKPGLRFVDNAPGLWIRIDPAMKVSIIEEFIDNTLMHGKHATEIILSYKGPLLDASILFYISDNGVGIPNDEKEKIFTRSYGNSNTFSLFYVREALELSNMKIREIGIPKQGACFEVAIPKELYKIEK